MALHRSVVLEESFYNWFNSGGDELMKKIKLLTAAVAMVGLVSSSIASADGFAPGEGLYLGVFGGGGMGIVQPKVTTYGNTTATSGADACALGECKDKHEGGTWEATDGGLGLAGIEGGGWVGYGYKMGDMYAGLEGEMAASDTKFKLSGDTVEFTDGTTITAVEAEKKWTGGMFGRLGFYVNDDTLLSFKGGVLVSKFEVKTTGSTDYSENYYGGGPAFGASLTSRIAAIDPNLSIRLDGVYTDYLTASVFGIGGNAHSRMPNSTVHTGGHDSEVTGSALSARIGLAYSFFDVNSLF